MIRALLVALGLMLCLAPLEAHADDFAPCSDPTINLHHVYLQYFDERLNSPEHCELVTTATIHWRTGTATLRAIRLTRTPMTDNPIFVARVREIADEVSAAMDRMGGALSLNPNVTILFTDMASPRPAGSPDVGFNRSGYLAGASTPFANTCPITYYKATVRSPGDSFVFVTEHEIFHCIQYRTWPSMLNEAWLTEGSAEYFAYLAKPGFSGDNSVFSTFDANIPNTALNNMNYPAVVFFAWLGNAYNPQRVRDFTANARSIETAIAPDMLMAFSQGYYEQSIRLPDGRALPSTPVLGAVRAVHGDDVLRITDVTPYTFNDSTLAFDRDKFYQLTYPTLAPDLRMEWRKAEGGAWGAPLTEVTTCDGEERYRVIWTSTHSTSFGNIEVRAHPAAAGVCTCPAGTWMETDGSLRGAIEQTVLPGGQPPRFISGKRVLTLNPDHTGSFTYLDVISETHTPGDPTFWLRQTKTGGSHFTWRTINGTLFTVLTPGNNLLNLHNEQHTRSGVLVENRPGGVQSIGHQYACDASGLHLTQHVRPVVPGAPPINYNIDMDFVRLSAPPAPSPAH